MEEKLIGVDLLLSGSSPDSQIMSINLCDYKFTQEKIFLNIFYCEFLDLDFSELSDFSKCFFRDTQVLENHNTRCYNSKTSNNNHITTLLDTKKEVKKEIISYLKDLSNNGKYKLKFICNNNIEFIYFLQYLFEYEDDALVIPDYFDYNSIDYSTLSYLFGSKCKLIRGKNSLLNAWELVDGYLKFIYN